MNKRNSRSNEGFSLVELIVVVLIMAIIAVGLAPQVMKWVEESRKSADAANYDAIYESAKVALTNHSAYKKVCNSTEDIVIKMTTNGTSSEQISDGDDLDKALDEINPGWKEVKAKNPEADESNPYIITIKAGVCSLSRNNPPNESEQNSNPPMEQPDGGTPAPGEVEEATPTPTQAAEAESTTTPTAVAEATPTPTPTATPTPTVTPTPTPTPTATPTPVNAICTCDGCKCIEGKNCTCSKGKGHVCCVYCKGKGNGKKP